MKNEEMRAQLAAQTIDTCNIGHKFLKLADHPKNDGIARCPYCLSEGLDLARAQLSEAKAALKNLLELDQRCGALEQRRLVTAGETSSLPAPTQPVAATARLMSREFAKAYLSGGETALTLALQIFGYAACKDCGYVNTHCRCAPTQADPPANT